MPRFGVGATVCLVFVLCSASTSSPAQTLTTLHNFAGQPNDGADPTPGWCKAPTETSTGQPLRRGQQQWHGLQNHPQRHADHAAQLHGLSDGANPYGRADPGHDGNFYGTTYVGGSQW